MAVAAGVEGPVEQLAQRLQRCQLSADVLVTLFYAAAHSPVRSSVCKPYPPFLENSHGELDFYVLDELWTTLPSVAECSRSTTSTVANVPGLRSGLHRCDDKTLALLHWLLCTDTEKLDLVSLAAAPQSQDVVRLQTFMRNEVAKATTVAKPSYGLAVVSEVRGPELASASFAHLAAKYGTFFAYHGSPLTNAHSILRNGFNSEFNRRQLYGPGLYFTTNLNTAVEYSGYAPRVWEQSCLGKDVAVVFVCEVVNGPFPLLRRGLGATATTTTTSTNFNSKSGNTSAASGDSNTEGASASSADAHTTNCTNNTSNSGSSSQIGLSVTSEALNSARSGHSLAAALDGTAAVLPPDFVVVADEHLVRPTGMLVFASPRSRAAATSSALTEFLKSYAILILLVVYLLMLAAAGGWKNRHRLSWFW